MLEYNICREYIKFVDSNSVLCGIQRTFETIMRVYESQALDPHVNRERFRDEWLE
jgi:hypothetical protein